MATFALSEHGVQAIVVDIEGTTTPIGFVYDVLFPFARAHLREYLGDLEADQSREMLRQLRVEWSEDVARGDGPPEWAPFGFRVPGSAFQVPGSTFQVPGSGTKDQEPRTKDQEAVALYVEWLMDRDRKSPALKLLQGQIWEQGYRTGALQGEVFPDVPAAFQRWRDARIDVAIYSSGSELAQRLLFGGSREGDLTPFISRFFDTAVGPKVAVASYRRIASELACSTERVLFVSDVAAELDAARSAGCQVLMCVRPGNRPQATDSYAVIQSFDEIAP